MWAMKSADAALESNVKISFPSCVERCEAGGTEGGEVASWLLPPQGSQAIE